MQLDIPATQALWFLPFVLPVCVWVAWSDLRSMRIPNKSVMALVGIFVVIGLFAVPFPQEYLWRLAQLLIVLALGFLANMVGLMGAGDSKFLAAAAPFIVWGDAAVICFILSASLLSCFAAHRIAKYTPLRRLAPEWESWDRGRKFPMGTALGLTLSAYLVMGATAGL